MSGDPRARGPAPRQAAIAERVLAAGSATAAELAERFDVSLMTIHRDLDELERQGLVRKFRGGVTAQPSGVFESNVAYRLKTMRAQKAAVAEHALRLIEPGMAVMLDDSTSTLEIARRLVAPGGSPAVTPLTVVTNFLEALTLLSGERGIHLMALGGDYDPLHSSFLGVSCTEAIQLLQVDICFTSTSAVSGGFAYHQEQHIVSVKRAMLDSAARNVLLLDHSKLGRVALHRLAPLSRFDLVLVDDGAAPELLRDLDEHKVPYEVCPALTAARGATGGPDHD
ncbi:DeoR family transcriptional regulator [Streptomyces agglomeratus]|uniref:DeoR family transcriptional regulator n=1 Tax=Streptomyces agglomeratus TaxID=285458 RepID=A0A1E5PBD4_9ACTN|nr:DeoR/GlpR family DNA-binding transcription regulator [Streptomyces agglomeratus]OEJ26873.1 DeoR family transcriptional regulator [Streptomyces agglomeratus]OEJ39079.1 DeoR family transcriptional regulator [Streptomyces agglomeratus]OEJ46539.1 DeoR family transcriptional regulator [Streptomyces agglomeratus]OEJ51603.1 DeoR family transcriptional regulator [Streptomyces agglomeratus]OEJ59005.1 DeoR family transcriptional regulator [Streptomyces agglomeratus]